MPAYRDYRRWAFESAAADLALRQAGPLARRGARARAAADQLRRLAAARRAAEPRAGDAAGSRPTRACSSSSTTRPRGTTSCSRRSSATGAVESIDFKGAYKGTPVDVDDGSRRSTGAAPRASRRRGSRIPDLTGPAADEALRPHRDRITWDAPIHGVADIEELPFQPRTINVKPSRIGTWKELLRHLRVVRRARHHQLRRRPVRARRRPRPDPVPRVDLPRRTSRTTSRPSGYDWAEFPETGLPASPLPPDLEPTGFRRRS